MKYSAIIIVLSLITVCRADEVYQFTDSNGNLVIGNTPANPYGNKRRQILQEELSREKTALKEANDMLAQNAKSSSMSQARNSNLQDAIQEHQKNIDILSKQLGYVPK